MSANSEDNMHHAPWDVPLRIQQDIIEAFELKRRDEELVQYF